MIRFIHTSDWQIGARLSHLGAAASGARQARLDAAQRTIHLATRTGAGFVIIAGDLFEDHSVGNQTVAVIVDILGSCPVPVFVLPGNHDPLIPGGIWDRPAWTSHTPNVRLLTDATPIEHNGVVLYPCPLSQKRSTQDPTAWIPPDEQHSRIRIGIAHGSAAILGGEVNFPIDPDRTRLSGLDYLALGDWHSPLRCGPSAWYSGTPETSSFSERDSGHALEVVIDGPSQTPAVTRHRVGALTWERWEVDVSTGADLELLAHRIGSIPDPGSTLLRINLAGAVAPGLIASVERFRDDAAPTVMYLELNTSGLKTVSGEMVDLPPGPVSLAGAALSAAVSGRIPTEPDHPCRGQDTAIIRRALELLHYTGEEVRR